jgi:hypothetical protein
MREMRRKPPRPVDAANPPVTFKGAGHSPDPLRISRKSCKLAALGERVVRAGLMGGVAAAVFLSGCARDPYVSTAGAIRDGNWRIERQLDRVTGAPLSNAFVISQNVSSSAIDFPRPASLSIHCFKGDPIVRLAFDFKVGSTRNSVLGYQFDGKPGREVAARFLQDFRTVVIEDKTEVAQFVDDLAGANALYVRIRSLNAGRSSAEFKVDGAPAAIAAAYAGCPVLPKRTSA